MIIPTIQPNREIDTELAKSIALKARLDIDIVQHYLQYNMLPLHIFATLARISQGSLSRAISPGCNYLTVVRPYPRISDKKKVVKLSGPKMIFMDDKAIHYLKHNRYDVKRKKLEERVSSAEF